MDKDIVNEEQNMQFEPWHQVGDHVLFVLQGESKPFGGKVLREDEYFFKIESENGLEWMLRKRKIVRSAVTTPAALKGALASVNPSKALGKAHEREEKHLTKAGDV